MGHTFAEAIALARDTYVQIGSPSPYVRIDSVLRYAERVTSNADGKPHTISVEETDWVVSDGEPRGTWKRGPTSSTIYVSGTLNACWRRFVICKEAIHLMVDDQPGRYAQSVVSAKTPTLSSPSNAHTTDTPPSQAIAHRSHRQPAPQQPERSAPPSWR